MQSIMSKYVDVFMKEVDKKASLNQSFDIYM